MRTEIINVTPELAAQWHVTNPRPVRKTAVTRYARDMLAGKWQLSHQGIAFNKEGKLIDGQHRLRAIIQSGVTVPMSVTYDVDDNAFAVFDSGIKRSAADSLAIDGLTPAIAKIISAAFSYIEAYENNNELNGKAEYLKRGSGNLQVLEFYENNPDIVASAGFSRTLPRRDSLLPDSHICFLHYIITKQHGHDQASQFLTLLLTGDGVDSSSPIFEMRRQLISSRMSRNGKKTPFQNLLKRIIRTYNLWNKGKVAMDFKQILWRADAKDFVKIEA
jgi:hypothetical protein